MYLIPLFTDGFILLTGSLYFYLYVKWSCSNFSSMNTCVLSGNDGTWDILTWMETILYGSNNILGLKITVNLTDTHCKGSFGDSIM